MRLKDSKDTKTYIEARLKTANTRLTIMEQKFNEQNRQLLEEALPS
jgi:hypothetical protein